jgi:UDP-N-acetylglucosamine acyltransferase
MTHADNTIHPTAIIGPNVRMGRGNYIGPYCVLRGRVEIGDNNKLVSHVSIGSPPEHRGFVFEPEKFEDTGTITIGSNNTFFEFVAVNHPSKTLTSIGSNCFIQANVYIPHDGIIEDGVTIANGCAIGGHAVIMRGANLGFSESVHQFTTIGAYCMVGMGSVVLEDLAPFCVYVGTGPRRLKLNKVGLSRAGFDEGAIYQLEQWVASGDSMPQGIPAADEIVARFRQYAGRR